jgi:hypothetical protein
VREGEEAEAQGTERQEFFLSRSRFSGSCVLCGDSIVSSGTEGGITTFQTLSWVFFPPELVPAKFLCASYVPDSELLLPLTIPSQLPLPIHTAERALTWEDEERHAARSPPAGVVVEATTG